jgi:tRNA threonylcarbamoyladenosine dehydratase
MVCRSGVGKLRLIDFDQVSLSSLNRHAVATLADVGTSKAQAMYKHLKSIVPWCTIEPMAEMFVMSEAERLLSGKPDLVVDCIDDVNTKAELIAYCHAHKIPVLTSMGAGGKSDPTRLRIAPITDCINDPLAHKIKWKLKQHNVPVDEIMCVYSIEKPVCGLLPLDDEQKNAPQVH